MLTFYADTFPIKSKVAIISNDPASSLIIIDILFQKVDIQVG